MSHNSDTILELLKETDAALSKRGIEVNLERHGVPIPYDTLKKQVEVLSDYGLVQRATDQGGWYELTDKGRAYLDGELSRDELLA